MTRKLSNEGDREWNGVEDLKRKLATVKRARGGFLLDPVRSNITARRRR